MEKQVPCSGDDFNMLLLVETFESSCDIFIPYKSPVYKFLAFLPSLWSS